MFYKVGVFKIFSKLTGKHLCWRLFFNKIAGFRPLTLFLKKSIAKFLRIPIYGAPLDSCFCTTQIDWIIINIIGSTNFPTITPRVFNVEKTWKRRFPPRLIEIYTWCVCGVVGVSNR